MNWPIRHPLSGPWHLAMGPLDLWLQPGPTEVEAVWEHHGSDERPLSVDQDPAPAAGGQRIRIAVTGFDLKISPRSAPLPVMARAERPILVGPGRTIQVFVGTPLWLQIDTDAGPGPEVPTQPVKHTWAGPTTEGHLCVATRTLLRLSMDNLQWRDHRVVTMVELRNQHHEPLRVERMALPLPLARIYTTDRGLWTETLRLVHRGERTEAETIGPPRAVSGATLVAEARSPVERSALKNVFGAVLGGVT